MKRWVGMVVAVGFLAVPLLVWGSYRTLAYRWVPRALDRSQVVGSPGTATSIECHYRHWKKRAEWLPGAAYIVPTQKCNSCRSGACTFCYGSATLDLYEFACACAHQSDDY